MLSRRAASKGCAVAAALLLGGCLPGTDSDDGFRAGMSRFVAGGEEEPQVNRSEKRDALPMSQAADDIGDGVAATVLAVRRAGEHLVSLRRPPGPGAGDHLPEAEPIRIEAGLADFFAALRALETRSREKPVTILHLGDGHIVGDRFSGDLRDQFQSRFGKSGRGLMAPSALGGRGVKVDHGGAWRVHSSADGDAGLFGVTGMKLVAAASDAWIRVTSLEGPFDWVEVTLETGPKQAAAVISIDGEDKIVQTDAPTPDWKTIRLNRKGRELTIRSRGDGGVKIHSWNIGLNRPGVNYVNLGLQKATALTADRWSPTLIAADLKQIQPDLIVLSYGTTEGFDDELNVAAYEQRLMKLIARLKTLAPQASFVIIGPPDAARMPAFAASGSGGVDACRPLTGQELLRYGKWMQKGDARLARWHTPPKLGDVRAAMRRVAAHAGAYFWDWSKIMGGPCGIHGWVYASPALAAPDHVSLTPEGAKRSARALFAELMAGYSIYSGGPQATASTAKK